MSTPASAPATVDASAGSSPAAASAAPQTTQQRMLASMAARRAAAAPAGDAPPEAPQPAPETAPEAGSRPTPEAEGQDAREGQEKDEKTIPMGAFKERLAREARAKEALRQEVATRDLELGKAKEAIGLLSAELERLRGSLRDGKPYDERDDALAAAELERRAREVNDRLLKEHEEKVRQQQEQLRTEAEIEQYRLSYERDISAALTKYPLVDRAILVQALKVEASKARPATAVQIAELMQQELLAKARKLGFQPPPETPETPRAPSSGTPTRFENNAKGMQQWLAANRR